MREATEGRMTHLQDEVAVDIGRPFSLLYDIMRRARFMMSHTPLYAELAASTHYREAVDRASKTGRRIIRCNAPDGTVDYIVRDGGTIYTTWLLPTGVTEDDIADVSVPIEKYELREDFITQCDALNTLQPQFFADCDLQTLRNRIDSYYIADDAPPQTHFSRVADALCDALPAARDPASSDEAAYEWAESCRMVLHDQYHRCHLSGHDCVPALATLYFFLASGISPAGLYYGGTLGNLAKALGDEMGKPVMQVPALSLEYYLDSGRADASIFAAMLNGATKAARLMHREADRVRRSALDALKMKDFISDSANAVLGYQVALHIYQVLLRSSEIARDIVSDVDGIRADSILCEEARVASLIAIDVSRMRRRPDFMDLASFSAWINDIRSAGFGDARDEIHSFYQQCLFPAFVKEIAVGAIEIARAETREKGMARLGRAADQLEQTENDITILGEPPFRLWVYLEMARTLDAVGRGTEARVFEERAKSLTATSRLAGLKGFKEMMFRWYGRDAHGGGPK
jgi:hypothetical protein